MVESSNAYNDDEYIKELGVYFLKSPILHGQVFDDNRRWCLICSAPRVMNKKTVTDQHSHMMCSICDAIWPEFVSMVEESLGYDEDVIEDEAID